ncbi:uncharacterized protein LY79DRAFT_670287 [Colletotrichum navitas]|uniref:CFEM domain-containing protein n=1 Tax=Colletotrichum navitas TaxID=681940 RepID=A0AAD8PXG5_9PEZI|nr:uncharacterized protein LY79DRAFT_670287 [Colletotrichum navitas]KAK1589889.1 hypothetical protein LY79DRAFT_670287 [Colletotrichum navitas]
MKHTAITSLLVAIVAADTINQLVDQIPTCAVTCISDQANAVGCDITNFACSCGKISELTPKVVSCLATSGCSTADQAKVFQITPQICAQIGQNTTTATAAANASSPTATGAMSTAVPAAAGKVQAAGWAGVIAAAAAAAAWAL